jgi:hypothetical protein
MDSSDTNENLRGMASVSCKCIVRRVSGVSRLQPATGQGIASSAGSRALRLSISRVTERGLVGTGVWRLSLQTPHDQIFHYTFGQTENAADLLRSTLPAAVSAAIDWRTLTRCDTKLTDATSESLYADLLFTVSVLGTTTYLLFLCEHKSEEDRMTALQLLPYLPRIWGQHVHEARLPPILCVVLHHGRKPWQGPRSLREMIDVSGLPSVIASLARRSRRPTSREGSIIAAPPRVVSHQS